MDKTEILKEKFKNALESTVKVIANQYKIDKDSKKKNSSSNNLKFFELDNLNNKNDFIRLRAKADSEALKQKFSNKEIYNKNSPSNTSCKNLYAISEKIRYEILGSKMLKGVSSNLINNYRKKINLKRKDQLKSKDDTNVVEAFELYMLKNFMDIKLNSLSEKILDFWVKEFDNSLSKHFVFLKKNLENQQVYNSKISELLKTIDVLNYN